MSSNMVEAGSLTRCILEVDSPNSYYQRPELAQAYAMPAEVRSVLDDLWNRSVHTGTKIRMCEAKRVFVAQQGLVFSESRELLPESRTYHNDQEIGAALADIETAVAAGNIPVIEKAILARARGADNYGHFILEMLPRVWYARKWLDVPDWPVLVQATAVPLARAVDDSLAMAGVPGEMIVRAGNEPIVVERLIVVDGLTRHSQYMSPFVMSALDEISASVEAGSVDMLYVSRGPGAARDFIDEPAVARRLGSEGYVEISCGTIGFRQQVQSFKGASKIAGLAGAALSNIAFCRPGTEIECFMPASALEVLFWMIAEQRRLRYREIRCVEEGQQLGPLPWDRKIRFFPGR